MSYKGVLGDSIVGFPQSVHSGSLPDCHAAGGCNGLFWRVTYREPQSFAGVTDGLSNTLMIGEDVASENNHSAAFYANGDWAGVHTPLNQFLRPPRPDDWWDVIGFRSRHPGIVQFGLADGSVRSVGETIDKALLRALSTRAGREVAAVP